MIFLSSIRIPGSNWIWYSLILAFLTLVFLAWTYRRANALRPGNKAAFLLKLLGVLILAACLIEPLWSGKRAKPGANLFAIVTDNSSGMNIFDYGMDESRGQMLKKVISPEEKWLATLAQDFQLRQYIFDSHLKRTTDFSELEFDGKTSSIGTSILTIAERYKNRPLAGILLLSDGNATDIIEQSLDLPNDMPPVYPVIIGGSRPQKDLSISNVSVSQSSFEDTPVRIQAETEASGFAGDTIVIDLLDDTGQLVERKVQRVTRDQQNHSFDYRVKPEEHGILFYNVKISPQSEINIQEESEQISEATQVNNQQTLVVDRGGGPYRILYVTGRLNWEYKFLRRAIGEDEQIDLVALLRVAKREPKFNFLGRTGETSNPLYRGFDETEQEDAAEYDQPVLVRLNTKDEHELSDGFPTTEEELYGYHAIIIDDLEAEFFTAHQMNLIRKFVSERGGGFLMLGGQESFEQGDFDKTAIGQILPLYLDRLPEFPTTGQMRLDLTREGWLQPWARLRDNEIDEQQRITEMPAFRVSNRLQSVKPGATVAMVISNDWTQEFPALVVQRYGNGRTGAITIGDIWRWGLKESTLHEDMDKFWRQTLRWLVADVPERLSVEATHKSDQVNQPVLLQVRVRDKAFEPMDNVKVAIEVEDPQNDTIQLTAEPVLTESGLYEATYIPHSDGGYLARAFLVDSNDTDEIGQAQTGWATDLDAQEYRSIGVNRALLENIAQRTGGRIIESDELNEFANNLPSYNVPITETWIRPLWDLSGISPFIFIFVILCFTGEWALRRWRGMP